MRRGEARDGRDKARYFCPGASHTAPPGWRARGTGGGAQGRGGRGTEGGAGPGGGGRGALGWGWRVMSVGCRAEG